MAMRRKLNNKLPISFALVLALLLINAMLSFRNRQRIIGTNARVTQSHEALVALEEVLSTIQDAETGQRGYIITGQNSYLAPYQNAVDKIGGKLQRLRDLPLTPQAKAALPTLEKQVQLRLDSLRDTAAVRQRSGLDAAQQRVANGQGNERMNDIRDTITAMENAETALLRQRNATARNAERNTLFTFLVSSLSSLALLSLAYLIMRRDIENRRRAENQLTASRDRFGAIVNASAQIVWTRDVNGNFVEEQPSWSAFTGQSFDELKGSGWLQAIHPEDRARIVAAWRHSVETRQPLESEYRLRCFDGNYRISAVRALPVNEEDGTLREWVGTNTDITERRRAESELHESQRQFQMLANSIPQLAWMADGAGDIFWYNQRWYDYTGTTLEEMKGWGWQKVHHPDYVEGVSERWAQAIRENRLYEETFPLRGKDGEYGWFLTRVAPVRDEAGKVVRWFGTNTDVTKTRETEAELHASEARKAAILETALDCIIAIDHESNIIEWNPASEKTFGHARADVIGRKLPEIIIPLALREAHRTGLAHYLKTGEGPVLGQRIEVPALHADGHEFPIELAITRVAGEGAPVFSAYLRDITERVAAEEKLAMHANLSSLSADVGLALNRSESLDEILQQCAAAMVKHLDAAFARIWTLNEIENVLELQASAGMYTHLDGAHGRVPVGQFKIGLIAEERLPHLTNQVIGDERVADQEWAEREGMVSFAGYPLLVNGRLLGVMGMFARHELSNSVLRSLATVADAIALGVRRKRGEEELERAKQAAETANKTKSLFLANMSHELRTPLNAILGYSEMLEEEAVEQDLQEFVPDLEKINGAGKHLLSLINDILDLSKIEAGKMELYLEDFDVADMLDEIVATAEPLVAKNGNTLHREYSQQLGTMHGDLTKVKQCLFNLISNAAKFTTDGSITLEARREKMEGVDDSAPQNWLLLRITDSGIGMSAEQILGLFKTFAQADASTTRKFGGTGLGLALTRRFAQMMGGDVTVQSVPDEGSVFTLHLPLHIAAAVEIEDEVLADEAPPMAEKIEQLPAPGTCVLVIDDDAVQRDLMRRFLEKEGFPAYTAASGEEGLKMAHQLRPIVITLDVMMPGMDGWSVLAAIKNDEQLHDIPVIMLTMVDDKNRGYALGAADYATKPVNRARLTQILQKYACSHPPCPVLLVEDDDLTRSMMRAMLEKSGWTVSEARNGREALERVAENSPSLILLDLMMPEMDGFEFAVELHRHEQWRSIPVVVLTAKDLTEADHLRLNGYVQKIMQKAGQSREEMMRAVRDLVASCKVPQKTDVCETQPPD